MAYTARSVTAAVTPWPLTIGGTTYTAQPLSAALVLRVLPMLAHPATRADGAREAIRASIRAPHRPWWRRVWKGAPDPVAAVLSLEDGLQSKVLQTLFSVPGLSDEATEDPEQALIRAHRRLSRPQVASRGPTLAVAALTCEVVLGAAWYFDPRRWPTSDGFAPLATVWTTYLGLHAIEARERLSLASAVQLGMASGPKVAAALERLHAAAYPADPTTTPQNAPVS